MSGRLTAIIEVKETIDAHALEDSRGYPLKQGVGGSPVMQERQVIERLRVVVSAGSERDAVERAIKMLQAHLENFSEEAVYSGESPHPIRPAGDI